MFEEARKRTLVSAVVFAALATAKFESGVLFHSVIMIGDGIHSFSDVFMTIMVYLGLRVAERPASEKFPFGLYKLENMVSLVVAAAIGFAAVEIARDSLSFIRVSQPAVPIIVEIISAAASYSIMVYLNRTPGIALPSMKAQGLHAYQDVLSSLIVVVGVVAEWLSMVLIAEVVGILIGAYIMFEAYRIAKDAVYTLLDVGNEEITEKIRGVVSGIEGVVGVHEIRVRQSGPFYFVEMHLEAPANYSVQEADALADKVEGEIKRSIPSVVHVSIHVEPGSFQGKWIVAIPEQPDGSLRGHMATVPLIKIVDTKSGKVDVIDNPALGETRRKGVRLAKELKNRGVEVVLVREIGEGMLSSLKGEGMMVLYSPTSNEAEALAMFKRGELKPAEASPEPD
ncbi:MAG: cation diffusion facilitator family transporter [TACK group archaeon]|nr:cation diffusion facilitator family transporter [TACK group archaeon]